MPTTPHTQTLHYQIICENPQQRFIKIRVEFPVSNSQTIVKLPSWRPGRYELGNFAKNIKGFRVLDASLNELAFRKTNKDTWEIVTENTDKITVEYSYFANELNAGSTYFDENQLYVNPVNCMVYMPELIEMSIELQLNISSEWQVACGLEQNGLTLKAANFDQLADSPFICSACLQKGTYQVNEHTFYIWFNGIENIPWERVISDFKRFTEKQLEHFSEFPTKDFHFLIHVLPYPAYHGVEHVTSTVLTLGPTYAVFNELYSELLGVSSHELYHVWNVKTIRPTDMLPYDFSEENYSELGYVYEGVTTYLGDLYLLKSGVFDLKKYLEELKTQLQKHFDTLGRFNYSVAQSSFDTWLDGYVPGIPGRKTSIYTEGCLLAFVCDIAIRKATNNQKGIEDAMRTLYFETAKKGIGYTRESYQSILEETAGVSLIHIFDNFIYGTKAFDNLLNDTFEFLGLEWKQLPSDSFAESRLGIKYQSKNGAVNLLSIYPESPAEQAGLSLNDEIIAVNEYRISTDFDRWLMFLATNKTLDLILMRNGKIRSITIQLNDVTYYKKQHLNLVSNPSKNQKEALTAWKK